MFRPANIAGRLTELSQIGPFLLFLDCVLRRSCFMNAMDTLPHRAQVGALPVRGNAGAYEVLLITSRDSGRWIIPKGWPMKGKKDHDAAAQEAFEEAGVRGRIHQHPMGAYAYEKRLGSDTTEPVRVMVYLLEVREEVNRWPERTQRRREWMTATKAVKLVVETGLAEILARLNIMSDARSGFDRSAR